jgi:OHCU decarboxylase
MTLSLNTLNKMGAEDFIESLRGVVEFESVFWMLTQTYAARPFRCFDHLCETFANIIYQADTDTQLALLHTFPELGSRIKMGVASTREQTNAGLKHLTAEEYERMTALNASYTEKFGFPFVFAVTGKTKEDVFRSLEERVHNTKALEMKTALQQACKVVEFRLIQLLPETPSS